MVAFALHDRSPAPSPAPHPDVSRASDPSPIHFVSHDWIETAVGAEEVTVRHSLIPEAVGGAVICPNGGGTPCRNCQLFALWQEAF